MTEFQPINLQRKADYVQFEDASGLEYEVYGGDSRLPLAFEIAANSKEVVQIAEGLLRSFIKFDGVFTQTTVKFFATLRMMARSR